MTWIEERIREVARKGAKRLNLSWCRLDRIPEAVFGLTSLEVLDLEGNSLRTLPKALDRLPELRRIDLRWNPLGRIRSRPGLVLDWSSYSVNERTIRPEHVVGLRMDEGTNSSRLLRFPALTLLDLSTARSEQNKGDEGVRSLLGLLSTLAPHIEELELFCCGLSSLPESLFQLSRLRYLGLSGNPLRTVPEGVAALGELRFLSLQDALIEELPAWLFDRVSLESLRLGYNELRTLPEPIGRMEQLRELSLACNRLRDLPPSIRDLGRLRALDLSDNLLTEIPPAVFELPALERLYIGADVSPEGSVLWSRGGHPIRGHKTHAARLREIPSAVVKLEGLSLLDVSGQPIETPPLEVVQHGAAAVQDYWRQRGAAGTDHLAEAKLLIIGEPGAGKTSLARKILDPAYPLDAGEASTEGIDVLRWQFPATIHLRDSPASRALARRYDVNIWDFGGQEIYHATHQFFLTRRSLYVLVADSRKEDTDFHYWLNVVELLSDESPLILVKNEKQDRRREIDEAGLRGRFANLREVVATNLDGNRGLDEVIRCIRRYLEGLPHIGEALPATWKRVREALERDPRDYLAVDEYLRICDAHGFKRREDKLQLSGYLHDLGICLHFQDDPVLKGTVILKPKWGTDAVYRVLDHPAVIEHKGRFERRDLEAIWSEPGYAPMRDELLQLMMRFRLCYRLEGTETYIAPQLLGAAQPSYRWDGRDNLALKYRYDFMPKGILTQLIVGLHRHIAEQSLVWRGGVVLERDGTRCEVIEDYPRREISVRAAGAYPRELLAIVDHELGRIHAGFKRLRYDTLVPCRCAECRRRPDPHFYPFEVLRRFARDGKAIQCHHSYEMVDVRALIEAVFPQREVVVRERDGVAVTQAPEPPRARPGREVFVSYAWGGESEAVVDALQQALAARGIALARDKDEIHYRDSIRDFMRRIGEGKSVVVVLSRKYLESHYCMFELLEIEAQKGLRDRVFPIVLPDAGIFDPAGIVDCVKHWEERVKVLDEKMREVELTNLEGVQEEINLYRRIRAMVARIVDVLRDMNARTVASHRAEGFAAIVAAIEARLAEA